MDYNSKSKTHLLKSLCILTQFQFSVYIIPNISHVHVYVTRYNTWAASTVFVTDKLCKSGYSHHKVKQHIIFAVYSRVTSLRTHLLRAIRPLADKFHLAHFVSSICPVVTTMSLVMSADSNPSQFSSLTRELLILLYSHLLATLKGLTLQPE